MLPDGTRVQAGRCRPPSRLPYGRHPAHPAGLPVFSEARFERPDRHRFVRRQGQLSPSLQGPHPRQNNRPAESGRSPHPDNSSGYQESILSLSGTSSQPIHSFPARSKPPLPRCTGLPRSVCCNISAHATASFPLHRCTPDTFPADREGLPVPHMLPTGHRKSR